MAYDPAPTSLFDSYSSNGTNITIPIASLPTLSAGEAHTSTGDKRVVARALCERLYAAIHGLDTADKPVRFRVAKSSSLGSDGNIRQVFTFTFDTAPADIEVLAEP